MELREKKKKGKNPNNKLTKKNVKENERKQHTIEEKDNKRKK